MAGSPKYLVQKREVEENLLILPEEVTRWNLFIESRKGEGIKQVEEIRHLLTNEETPLGWKWVPFSVIETQMQVSHNMARPRLIHLMKEMEENKLVKKKVVKNPGLNTANKNRTFYRYDLMADLTVQTLVGMKKEIRKFYDEKMDAEGRLSVAMAIIEKHGLSDVFFKEYHEIYDPKPITDEMRENGIRIDGDEGFTISHPKIKKMMDEWIRDGIVRDEFEAFKRALELLNRERP